MSDYTHGRVSYDGERYLWVSTQTDLHMLAEIRGCGADLPMDENARRLVACWNALVDMDPTDLPAIFSALRDAHALLLQTSAAQEKTFCMGKIDAAVGKLPKNY